MVNVDFASPSLLLGTALIGCGVLLLNLRNFQNKVSRDADIVVAAMVSIVGSTLIFQGWRLDPLLLLCQALTTSVAFWYGLETFRLRSKEADLLPPQLPPGIGQDPSMLDPAQQAAQQQYYQQQQGFPSGGAPFLPPGREPYFPWGAAPDMDAASTSGRAGGQSPYGSINSYTETIQYDYYGNPILPQEPMYGNVAYEQYGVPGGPNGQAAGEGLYGGPYRVTQGPGQGPSGPDTWTPADIGGQADYDGRGFSASPAPPYNIPLAPGGPYAATAGPVQPIQQQQYALPPVVRNEASGAVGTVGDSPYDSGYAGTDSGVAKPPAGAGDSGASWEALRPGAGSGSGGASGRGQPGRLDLYGKIDDWE